MESLINAFLCLARECSEPNQNCDLAPIVKHAVEQHQHLMERKQFTVDIAVTGSTLINAPEAVVSIAVNNLIRNAFLYTEEGQVRILVSNLGVSVEDTGIGIPASALAHVTEPRVRGEQSQGYGLGLSIVREFCQRFGWQLQLSSIEGMGTRATLQFTA
jgi:signal transduction histidine kinase